MYPIKLNPVLIVMLIAIASCSYDDRNNSSHRLIVFCERIESDNQNSHLWIIKEIWNNHPSFIYSLNDKIMHSMIGSKKREFNQLLIEYHLGHNNEWYMHSFTHSTNGTLDLVDLGNPENGQLTIEQYKLQFLDSIGERGQSTILDKTE